jgi:hypothetical protein
MKLEYINEFKNLKTLTDIQIFLRSTLRKDGSCFIDGIKILEGNLFNYFQIILMIYDDLLGFWYI